MFEEALNLPPLSFFALSIPCHYVKDPSDLTEEHFLPDPALAADGDKAHGAAVAMGWNEAGLAFHIGFYGSFCKPKYPRYTDGDAIELFIDTRDNKKGGSVSRYCHHFFFLPQKVGEVQAGEVTSFRTADAHPRCDPSLLQIKVAGSKRTPSIDLFIPKECLHGYEPDAVNSLGFTFTIRRNQGQPQDFAVNSTLFSVAQCPALWASLTLVKP